MKDKTIKALRLLWANNGAIHAILAVAIAAALVLSINASLAVSGGAPTVIGPQSIQAAIDTRSLIVRNASSLRGAVEMQDALSVTGPATFSDVTTTGGVTVTGAIIGSGDASYASVSTTGNITDAGALGVAGVSNLDGGIAVDTTNFTVHGTTGAVHSAAGLDALSAEFGGGYAGGSGSTFSAAGAGQFNGTLAVDGAATITGALTAPGGVVGALTGNVTASTAAITNATGVNATFTTVTATLVGNASGTNATYTTITGTLATPTQTNITSIGTLATAIINYLTSTEITGTLMTPTQTNVTSVGVLNSLHTIGELLANSLTVTTTASIADLSVTNPATITLATANQPNVTNLGSQPYLTATNFTVANITPSGSGSAANVNYCMSADCDTGMYYPGDNTIGIATWGVLRAQLDNTGLDVTPTLSIGAVSFTGPMKYGTAASYTSGDSISHGYATTPTMCILQPARDVTSTLTITETGFSSDMATVAEPIYWTCGK